MGKGAAIGWSVVSAFGIGLAASVGLDYVSAQTAKEWQVVQGRVLDSKLGYSSGPKGPSYWADIRYTYDLGDKRLVGTTVGFGPRIGSRDAAEDAVTKFPAGKQVSVYLNPRDPSEAVLEPGQLQGYWLWKLGIGLVLACVGGLFAFHTWRLR
jgi:hypothetical protein